MKYPVTLAPPQNDGSTHENEHEVEVMSVTRKSSQGPGGTIGWENVNLEDVDKNKPEVLDALKEVGLYDKVKETGEKLKGIK